MKKRGIFSLIVLGIFIILIVSITAFDLFSIRSKITGFATGGGNLEGNCYYNPAGEFICPPKNDNTPCISSCGGRQPCCTKDDKTRQKLYLSMQSTANNLNIA